MAEYLITGANGLLGQELIKQSLADRPDVRFLAVSNNCERFMKQTGGETRVRCCSWDDLDELDLSGFDAVIHCAFARSEKGTDLHKSLVLTGDILRAAGRAKVPLVAISSRSIYGQEDTLPWTEETEVGPNSLYALAKDAEELLTRQASALYGVPMTAVRLAGLIGIGMDARIVSKMVKSAVDSRSIKVVGGSQMFAMLDIRDAASGLRTLLGMPPGEWAETYNLGSGKTYTLQEMAQLIAEVGYREFGMRVRVTREEKAVSLLDGMDCTRFCAQTGWQPAYSLRDTVRSLFSFYMIK